MLSKNIECKNCEETFNETFEFCPHCGQKSKDELTLGILFYNTISNYFSFDARFFKSFIPLLFRPGYLARKFIEGKRLLYLHPAQLYLFISVVFFFLFSFVERDQAQKMDKGFKESFNPSVIDSINKKVNDSLQLIKIREALESNKFITGMTDKQIDSILKNEDFSKPAELSFGFDRKEVDSLLLTNTPTDSIYVAMGMAKDAGAFKKQLYKQFLKFYKNQSVSGIYHSIISTIPLAMFILLPIFALILKLFFYRRGRFAHHLVFSFYFFSFLFTVFSLLILTNFIVDIPTWLEFLIALSTFLYLLIAIKKFYQKGWWNSFFKTGFVTFIYMAIVGPIAFGLIIIAGFMFY